MQEKKMKGWKKGLCILLAVAAVLAAVVYIGFRSLYGTSNYVKDDVIKYNEELASETDLILESEPDFDYQVVEQVSQENIEGTYSILLVGTDTRADEYGNSDAMILLTINNNVKKVFLVSFMRDLYAEIPDVGVRKLNSAYAIGGGPLLVTTLESNYGVDIQNYVCVNFETMAEIIDVLGGVDMEMTHDEIVTANDYITSMAEQLSYDPEDYYIADISADDSEDSQESDGTYSEVIHLNGIQAVGYARIRYVGNADYERTNRQRKVLTALMDSMQDLDLSMIVKIVTNVLPDLTHNLTQSQILNLLSMAGSLMSYELVTDRIPYDGMYTTQGEILIPDMEATIQKLQSEIYATE